MLSKIITDGTCRLTLAKPERGNALSADLVEALLVAVDEVSADQRIHTLVLDAQGKHFCTGFDLSDLDTQTDGDLLQRFIRIETLLAAIWHAPLRTIAIAQGRVWGAGADLFAVCDARVATEGASFKFPGAGFGLVLGTRRLAERIGVDAARRCVVDGLILDAGKAQDIGLVDKILPPDMQAENIMSSVPAVDRRTLFQIHAATRCDHRDADLAALVRSASLPGLKQRIMDYRIRQLQHR